MVVVVTLRIGAMVFLLADVELTPENRTNPMLLRSVKKMDRAIDVAVIGDRDRFLSDASNMLNQLFDIARAIEQRVVGVQMQVCEFRHSVLLF
jgi:hypothetical protein